MYVCRYPWRPEKDVEFNRVVVTDACEPFNMVLGMEPKYPAGSTVCSSLPEDLKLIPRALIRWLTSIYNLNSKESNMSDL